jgi:hypothetical protein
MEHSPYVCTFWLCWLYLGPYLSRHVHACKLLTPGVVQAAQKTRGGTQTTTNRRKRRLEAESVDEEEDEPVDCRLGTRLSCKATVPTRSGRKVIRRKVFGDSDVDC